MSAAEVVDAPLAGVRVLEFDSPLTAHTGRLLWEMGADVVLVEPRAGSPMRGLAGGAVFAHHHAGKRCVADEPDGQVRRLLSGADVVVFATSAGSLAPDADDLDHALAERRELISLVLTPFGTTGPRARWHTSDLVVSALGGLVAQIGWPDEPPRPAPADQAWHLASLNGAVGVLVALAAADPDG